MLLTHRNHPAAMEALTQGKGLQQVLWCQGFQQGFEHLAIVSNMIKPSSWIQGVSLSWNLYNVWIPFWWNAQQCSSRPVWSPHLHCQLQSWKHSILVKKTGLECHFEHRLQIPVGWITNTLTPWLWLVTAGGSRQYLCTVWGTAHASRNPKRQLGQGGTKFGSLSAVQFSGFILPGLCILNTLPYALTLSHCDVLSCMTWKWYPAGWQLSLHDVSHTEKKGKITRVMIS